MIRSGPLLAFARFLANAGAPIERFADRVKLPRAALRDAETLLPLQLCGKFIDLAARSEGLEDLGFRASEHAPFTAMGAFGDLILQSPTLGEALGVWSNTRAIFNSGARVWLTHDRDRAWLHQALDPGMQTGRREAEQFWAIKALQLLRGGPGADASAFELHLRTDQFPGMREPALFARVDLRFGQPVNAIAFPRALLGRKLGHDATHCATRGELERRLHASRPAPDFANSVRQVARTQLGSGASDLNRTAAAISVSVRTLQRRLAESGVSFSRLIADERFARAVDLLTQTRASVTEIGFAVGYADLANFTHAFRRWTGYSPREFRRRSLVPSRPERASASESRALQ